IKDSGKSSEVTRRIFDVSLDDLGKVPDSADPRRGVRSVYERALTRRACHLYPLTPHDRIANSPFPRDTGNTKREARKGRPFCSNVSSADNEGLAEQLLRKTPVLRGAPPADVARLERTRGENPRIFIGGVRFRGRLDRKDLVGASPDPP